MHVSGYGRPALAPTPSHWRPFPCLGSSAPWWSPSRLCLPRGRRNAVRLQAPGMQQGTKQPKPPVSQHLPVMSKGGNKPVSRPQTGRRGRRCWGRRAVFNRAVTLRPAGVWQQGWGAGMVRQARPQSREPAGWEPGRDGRSLEEEKHGKDSSVCG